jgi:8-oxo-dGTP pyrophosphatase MutT (NUDIX family)
MKKLIPQKAVLIPNNAQNVFKGRIFDVYQWPQKLFDGSTETFEMLKRPDTVIVICVVDNQILVVDDEQPHSGSRKSFPGGRVDPTDASIEDAAKREVHEETGYSFSNWRLIQVWQPHNKIEWFMHVLLAWGETGNEETHLDPGEKITLECYSLEDLKTLILSKTGYLGNAQDIIENLADIEQLLQLPAFTGQTVDR